MGDLVERGATYDFGTEFSKEALLAIGVFLIKIFGYYGAQNSVAEVF